MTTPLNHLKLHEELLRQVLESQGVQAACIEYSKVLSHANKLRDTIRYYDRHGKLPQPE